jgi:hypothetical protein
MAGSQGYSKDVYKTKEYAMILDDQDDLTNYQDDLTTDDTAVDPIMHEENDDPTEILQVPPEEYKKEMDGLDIDDDQAEGNEDMREQVEDLDEDSDQGRA